MKLRITKENIRDGEPGEPALCAVALAIMDHLPGHAARVNSECMSAYEWDESERLYYQTHEWRPTPELQAFITDYDEEREDLDPIDFEIDDGLMPHRREISHDEYCEVYGPLGG